MVERGALRKWIFDHTEKEQQEEINNMTFVSYPYENKGEYILAFKEGSMNAPLCNLAGEYFTDGYYDGYEETLPFIKYLGKRIELALNFFKGKSNEEIENECRTGKEAEKNSG